MNTSCCCNEKEKYTVENFDIVAPELENIEGKQLNPLLFKHFSIVKYRPCKIRSTVFSSHRFKVDLQIADNATKTAFLTGSQVFQLMKPNWSLFNEEMRRYFMEYRDSPNFSL